MELLDAPTLENLIPDLLRERIRSVLSDVVAGARFLDDLGLVHRDIKPSNIVLPEGRGAVLLDLGVIRPSNLSELTDATGRQHFLGTLRYSPPEYLVREEAVDVDGARALTFYQLGALLHDMIMRKPLFADNSEPFARLVIAVMQEQPRIAAPDVASDLILLARNALVKDPRQRLRYVNWASFMDASTAHVDPVQDIRSRILARQRSAGATSTGQSEQDRRALAASLLTFTDELTALIRRVCLDDPLFPRSVIRTLDSHDAASKILMIEMPKSPEHALSKPLSVWLTVEILDVSEGIGRVSVAAALSAKPQQEPASMRVLHVGVLSVDALEDVFKSLIYTLFDQALEAIEAAPLATEPEWIVSVAEAEHE